MMIFHAFNPLVRPDDQVETWKALKYLTFYFPEIRIFNVPCFDDHDYEFQLSRVWGKHDDILIVEQDIVPTFQSVNDMMINKYFLAAQRYYLTRKSLPDMKEEKVCAHRKLPSLEFVNDDDAYADIVSLGMTYFSIEVQKEIDLPLGNRAITDDWRNLDVRLSKACSDAGYRFVLLEPYVKHNH